MEGYIGIVRCSFCEKTADQVKKIFYGSKGSCIRTLIYTISTCRINRCICIQVLYIYLEE